MLLSRALLVVSAMLVGVFAPARASERAVLPTNVLPVHYDVSFRPDARHLTFSGSVAIEIEVKDPTHDIVLNAADLTFTRVHLSGVKEPPRISFQPENETVTLLFPSAIAPGHYQLTIDYDGKIFESAAGLFALEYQAGKMKKRALFTQFENSDARRFLPCWDEPNRKATFSLSVTVPSQDLAVSNTPVLKSKRVGRGLKRVQFARTPKMSSYLLFYASGDLERVSRRSGKVDVGIVVKRGERARARHALDTAIKVLPYLEAYFGVAYPLPKLDFVAGPGSSQFFGAMENWGAIFYFERAILVDPRTTTENDKRRIFNVIAHEMAHQWFGDLVTMDWWEDLWLNEGYATWMASKVSDHFHPEWNVTLDMIDSRDRAMSRDGREGTHPIIQPILNVMQASQAFDSITYQKGGAVIRMLEDYVGADIFRKGVRNYISAHAYGNAVTDDLWSELDKVSDARVTEIAHDFTLQDGIPLIVAKEDGHGIELTQDRFAVDTTRAHSHSWRVPVIASVPGEKTSWRKVVESNARMEVSATASRGVLLNAGQTGYYRTLYSAELFKRLAGGFAGLAPDDQLGLLYDTRMLGYAGDVPLSQLFELVGRASPGMHPHILTVIAERLGAIDAFYKELPQQRAYRAFALNVLKPLFARVGWKAKRHEDANMPLLRAALLTTLGGLGDPGVVAEAKRRFVKFVARPASITAEERRVVLGIVSGHADATLWERLHILARRAPTEIDRDRYYTMLGAALDPALARRALELTLTDEVPVTTRPSIIDVVSREMPELAFDFVLAHREVVMGWLETTTREQYAPDLLANGYDPKLIQKLHDFADKFVPASAQRAVDVATSQIRFNGMVRTLRLPEADQWLEAHGYK